MAENPTNETKQNPTSKGIKTCRIKIKLDMWKTEGRVRLKPKIKCSQGYVIRAQKKDVTEIIFLSILRKIV